MKREEIIQRLFESMSAMKRGMYGQLGGSSSSPVPRAQLELLVTISHLQPVSFKALAQQLYLTPGAVSQLADSLAAAGLIEPGNRCCRHIQRLHISKKGEQLLLDMDKRRRVTMDKVMHDLSTQELATWLKIHQTLIAQFQQDHSTMKKEK